MQLWVRRQNGGAQPRLGNRSPGGQTMPRLTGSTSWVGTDSSTLQPKGDQTTLPWCPIIVPLSPTVPWQWSLSQRLLPLSKLAGFSSQQVSLRPSVEVPTQRPSIPLASSRPGAPAPSRPTAHGGQYQGPAGLHLRIIFLAGVRGR